MLRTACLATLTYDLLGHVRLRLAGNSTAGPTRRRVNRVATLDGGAVTNDFGYAEADRTIELRWQPAGAAQEAAVERLVQLYGRLTVSTASAVYLAVPETYTPGAQESRLRLLVLEKLSA
jgi:hypothetical protein